MQGAASNPANRIIGRGVYSKEPVISLGFGLDMMHGYVQSFNLTQSGNTLSLDAAVIAVPKQEPLLKLVCQVSLDRSERGT